MVLDISEWDGPLKLSDVDEKPKVPLRVKHKEVCIDKLGKVLKPCQIKDRPTIEWEGMDPKKLYTVILTDPDVPGKHDRSMAQWHHYLVVNVKGNDLNSGNTLTEYVGSGAGKGTGLHRYTWLVYEQPTSLKCDEPHLSDRTAQGREKFNAHAFRKKYGLGPPVAGVCFEAEWDESVPELYKQMGVA
ncbi:phosphatidylethanolamine-binding protein 1-like [Hyla sarda]|uniref:phosphatidylethanolamine-binding protein 1-like n=1 Tax=Hyla sarda TaxID=327740 RepID=UPI0024C36556|nr:phosphatidylethanolamine-binding protein 1-like [Hyla sarda]